MSQKEIIRQLVADIEKLKDKQGYIQAGLPNFRGLFGRDSLLTAWQLLPYDKSIARKTLFVLAGLQGKKENPKTGESPGKILHEYYPKDTPDNWWQKHKSRFKDWLKKGEPVYMSVDSTPLFIIILKKYYDYAGDFATVKKLRPNLNKAVGWLTGRDSESLLLRYQLQGKVGLIHQAWKDSTLEAMQIEPPVAVVEAQGYKYLALKNAAFLMKKLKKEKKADELTAKAAALKKEFNQKFWLAEEKYFAMALDKDFRPKGKATSNPGHLLFTGIVDRPKIDSLVKRLFKKDLWTPFGIRTYSSDEPGFKVFSYHMGSVWPHDNWLIACGLNRLGYQKEAAKIKKALLKAFRQLNCLPELYAVDRQNRIARYSTACCPQAWSSAGLLNLLLYH